MKRFFLLFLLCLSFVQAIEIYQDFDMQLNYSLSSNNCNITQLFANNDLCDFITLGGNRYYAANSVVGASNVAYWLNATVSGRDVLRSTGNNAAYTSHFLNVFNDTVDIRNSIFSINCSQTTATQAYMEFFNSSGDCYLSLSPGNSGIGTCERRLVTNTNICTNGGVTGNITLSGVYLVSQGVSIDNLKRTKAFGIGITRTVVSAGSINVFTLNYSDISDWSNTMPNISVTNISKVICFNNTIDQARLNFDLNVTDLENDQIYYGIGKFTTQRTQIDSVVSFMLMPYCDLDYDWFSDTDRVLNNNTHNTGTPEDWLIDQQQEILHNVRYSEVCTTELFLWKECKNTTIEVCDAYIKTYSDAQDFILKPTMTLGENASFLILYRMPSPGMGYEMFFLQDNRSQGLNITVNTTTTGLHQLYVNDVLEHSGTYKTDQRLSIQVRIDADNRTLRYNNGSYYFNMSLPRQDSLYGVLIKTFDSGAPPAGFLDKSGSWYLDLYGFFSEEESFIPEWTTTKPQSVIYNTPGMYTTKIFVTDDLHLDNISNYAEFQVSVLPQDQCQSSIVDNTKTGFFQMIRQLFGIFSDLGITPYVDLFIIFLYILSFVLVYFSTKSFNFAFLSVSFVFLMIGILGICSSVPMVTFAVLFSVALSPHISKSIASPGTNGFLLINLLTFWGIILVLTGLLGESFFVGDYNFLSPTYSVETHLSMIAAIMTFQLSGVDIWVSVIVGTITWAGGAWLLISVIRGNSA